MLSSRSALSANRGVIRTADDRRRGAIIERLLCRGRAQLSTDILSSVGKALQPFAERGLVSITGRRLEILPEGLPYARTIASLFDAHRQPIARQFSSAV